VEGFRTIAERTRRLGRMKSVRQAATSTASVVVVASLISCIEVSCDRGSTRGFALSWTNFAPV
jgi:hypothetical protein